MLHKQDSGEQRYETIESRMNTSILNPIEDSLEFDRLDYIEDFEGVRAPSIINTKAKLKKLEPKSLEVISDDSEDEMQEEGER